MLWESAMTYKTTFIFLYTLSIFPIFSFHIHNEGGKRLIAVIQKGEIFNGKKESNILSVTGGGKVIFTTDNNLKYNLHIIEETKTDVPSRPRLNNIYNYAGFIADDCIFFCKNGMVTKDTLIGEKNMKAKYLCKLLNIKY